MTGWNQEPDIIDLWFTRQLKAWCKKWWWLLVLVACMQILHIVSFQSGSCWWKSLPPNFYYPFLYSSFGSDPPHMVLPKAYLLMNVNFFLQDFLVIPSLALPSLYFSSIKIPAELILTSTNRRLHLAQLKSFRQPAWLLIGFLVMLPLSFLPFLEILRGSDGNPLIALTVVLGWISFYFAAVEMQIWAITRAASKYALTIVTTLGIVTFLLTRFFLFFRMNIYHSGFQQSSSSKGSLYSNFSPFTPLPYIFAVTTILLVGFAFANSKTPRITENK